MIWYVKHKIYILSEKKRNLDGNTKSDGVSGPKPKNKRSDGPKNQGKEPGKFVLFIPLTLIIIYLKLFII